MNVFLKRLRLKNYCQYIDHTYDFTKSNGDPYPYVCFFGPNGGGKTHALEAISLLTANTHGRPMERIRESLQKLIRNRDYDPVYRPKNQQSADMLIEGVFSINDKEYIVQITQDGWVRNDLQPSWDEDSGNADYSVCPWGEDYLTYRQRLIHFVRTDSDLSFHKFQIVEEQVENFEKIITEITRFPAKCMPSEDGYCTDFVVIKGDFNIHFKSMSAGEKKICKSFSDLLNMIQTLGHPQPGEAALDGWPKILLIDNVEMHVYYDRHVRLVDCIKRVFNRQQVFATTHSGTLITRYLDGQNDQDNELMIDVEKITHL